MTETIRPSDAEALEFLAGGGEMGALIRSFDWSGTALGPIEHWPQSLKTAVSTSLGCAFPIILWWGRELTVLYNDEYRPIFGAKHPGALGQPGARAWAAIWEVIGPMLSQVMERGEATRSRDLLLHIDRHGYPEEAYFSFSYSPIRAENGHIGGVFCPVIETTEKVIGERRLRTLRDLAAACQGPETEQAVCQAAASVLAANAHDVPFAVIYRIDERERVAELESTAGIVPGSPAACSRVPLQTDVGERHGWSLSAVAGTGKPVVVTDLAAHFDALPTGAWNSQAHSGIALPILLPGQVRPRAVLAAAVSPMRPLDTDYRTFFELLATQIASGLADAKALEEERRRAEALAEIDRAKTTFFSNVSHEFRTPLTLILGPLADAQRADDLPLDLREQLEVAHRNSLRLLKLVNTLLDFSRIEAGRVRARFEPVELCTLTADLASTFRSAMEKAGLEFTVDCEPLPEPIYVDREMWEKIVLNLLSNAFKFTLQGKVAVTVTRQGDRVCLLVEDTGSGIPHHELPHIFERFHRVEGTQGRSHEGSGIGLALVHDLVKLHGGELSAESDAGLGSRFSVAIPFGVDHLPPGQITSAGQPVASQAAVAYVEEALRWLPDGSDNEKPPQEVAVEGGAPVQLGHVLLADDNADMRAYARRLLAERWTVDVVGNGREALQAARARRPDVVVTDVMMPELDGFGLLRELRADPELRDVPLIMLSARAGEEARLEGLAATADDYLVKPFSARDLLARVDAQLVKGRARAFDRRHMHRLNTLFSQAPVAIAVLRGPEYVFELANPPYLQVIGGRNIVGLPIRQALPELEGQGVCERLDRVWQSGEVFVGRSWRVTLNRHPNGSAEEAYFDFVYQPVVAEHGQVESIVVVAHDVTALATAKNEAETANRLKDEFLATLSHELRTPLNAVLGYAQMLRGGIIPAERLPSVLETIERNVKLQEQLISDVLDVSRIITGKLRLDVQPVDLSRVIREAIETVAPAATAKGVRLQPAIDQAGVPVAGDPQRLQQVVWNLLSNAIKFTPRGGRVQVRLERVNSHIEIVVSDTGEGVPAEFLPHLFERFRQADSAASRAHGGLGLGLAICRHLVEAHGGSIGAVSPGRGQGTTVRVELPLLIVHDDTMGAPNRVHPHEGVFQSHDLSLPNLSGIRVLLVDDDRDARQMAGDALSIAGATVLTASSADEALAALDSHVLDVAILDVGMPGTDGYELLRRIRERSSHNHGRIPAAALTAYARAVDRTRSLQAGFQMHISKPVQPAELAAAVLALFRGARG